MSAQTTGNIRDKFAATPLCESEDTENNPLGLLFFAPALSDNVVPYLYFGRKQFHEWIHTDGKYEIAADFDAAFALGIVSTFDSNFDQTQREIGLNKSVEFAGYNLADSGYTRLEVESLVDMLPKNNVILGDPGFPGRVLRGYDLAIEAKKNDAEQKAKLTRKPSPKPQATPSIILRAYGGVTAAFSKTSVFIAFLTSLISVISGFYAFHRWVRRKLKNRVAATVNSQAPSVQAPGAPGTE